MSQNPMWVTLMSCLVDSLAKTSQLQVNEQALPNEREADYGLSSYALLAKLDHESLSWKTSQLSMFPQETETDMNNQAPPLSLLLASPKWAMMLSGCLYALPILARPTSAKDGSVWPTAMANTNQASEREIDEMNPRARLVTEVMVQERWGTPRANDSKKGANHTPNKRNGLVSQVKLSESTWLTPTASDNDTHKNDTIRFQSLGAQVHRIDEKENLNPDWVELLMGFPIGWTDIRNNGLQSPAKSNLSMSQDELQLDETTESHD